MRITTSNYLMSNTDYTKCPKPNLPEYAFIGRSNVGKSSLINMLCERKTLAKISGKPGKTQAINHFLINESWYLVDLPGYGYAKVAKTARAKWTDFILQYVKNRSNLLCLFILIDARIEPQKIDLEFINQMGELGVPFNLIFTKTDKLKANKIQSALAAFRKEVLKSWEEMPGYFVSSAMSGIGRPELLSFIDETNATF